MMYDFHYPLGWGKLNEDTANCRVKQSGMMGRNAGPASLSLSVLLALFGWKKGGSVLALGLWSPSPPYPAARRSSLTVHKSGAAYSRNYPESSTCNKRSDSFHPEYIKSRFKPGLLSTLLSHSSHLNSVSLSVCHILNFLVQKPKPIRARWE